MAEKQPNISGKLPISRVSSALKTKTGKQKKTDDETLAKKKELDRARNKTRVNIGVAFQRWRSYDLKGFKTDAELATFLLDKQGSKGVVPFFCSETRMSAIISGSAARWLKTMMTFLTCGLALCTMSQESTNGHWIPVSMGPLRSTKTRGG